MEDLITWIVISGLLFVASIILIGTGLVKQNKNLVIISVAVFFICFITSGITVYKFVTKSYTSVAGYLKPRTGEEIYKALFEKPQSSCVDVLNYKFQVFPGMDYTTWMHFKTCPGELKRIVSQHMFEEKRISSKELPAQGPYWFTPDQLQDTVIVYSYKKAGADQQTIYSNTAQTEAYCMDASE